MTFIGIDIGTFETKGVLVNEAGDVLKVATRRHGLITPQPGHVEHDPYADWWVDLVEVAGELMQHRAAANVAAIGVSAIGPCVVAVDESLEPLRNAILYGVDTRSTRQIEVLNKRLGAQEIMRRCGNTLTSQSGGPKIAWIRDEEPDVWAKARWFMTSQSWLVAKLTGEVVIDHATAGYFHPLYDLGEQRWDLDGCNDFIDLDRLPRLDWTTTIAGTVHAPAAGATGIPEGTPVIVGTTDAPAEAVAAGVVAEGDLMAMYGSSGYFIRVGSEPNTSPELWAAPFVFENSFVFAAGTSTTGTATRWIADLLDITAPDDATTFSTLLELADTSPVGARGVLALPHLAGERTPFQDPDSRAAFIGLGIEHHRGDVARALLEGVGHAVSEAILTYERAGVPVERVVAIGGGTQNPVITSTVSAITGLKQHIANSAGAAFGNAMLAALATGTERSDVYAWAQSEHTVRPDPAAAALLRAEHKRFVALYHALAPLMKHDAAGRKS